MGFNLKRWLGRVKSGAIRRRPLMRFRPGLVTLEDRLAPATLIVNSLFDNTTSDNVLTLREATLLVNEGGNASSALGRSLTAGEQAQITGNFGDNDTIQFSPNFNNGAVIGGSNAGFLLI